MHSQGRNGVDQLVHVVVLRGGDVPDCEAAAGASALRLTDVTGHGARRRTRTDGASAHVALASMKKFYAGMAVLGILALSVPVRGQMDMGMMGPGHMMMGPSTLRYRIVMRDGLDPQYASRKSPLRPTSQDVDSGKKLFGQHCASCHGATGAGDGPAGADLFPPPANVAAASKSPMASDSYLLWTISEGGAPTGSAMPPFKRTLTEDEIWKLIAYLRVL